MADCRSGAHRGLAARLRLLFEAVELELARRRRDWIQEAYGDRTPQAMATLADEFDDATAVLILPTPYHKRLRTSDSVERLRQEIPRRKRVIRILPGSE